MYHLLLKILAVIVSYVARTNGRRQSILFTNLIN